jgi:hypothetical protein
MNDLARALHPTALFPSRSLAAMNIDLNRIIARMEVLTLSDQQLRSLFVNDDPVNGELKTPNQCLLSPCVAPVVECTPFQKKRKFQHTPCAMASLKPRAPPNMDELLQMEDELEARADDHIDRANAEVLFSNAPRPCNELDWDDSAMYEVDSDATEDLNNDDAV